jgi:protein ImuB
MVTSALWLAAHLPSLPLTAIADSRPALAVLQSRGSRRWIVAATDTAIAPGTDLGTARQRRPEVIALERQPAREYEALETLACCAYAYSDRIAWRIDEPEHDYGLPRFTLWLEIGASLKLFGGLAPLLARIEIDFSALGHRPTLGVAPTLEAAAALARAGRAAVVDTDALPDALASLPLPALALPDAAHALIADIGLRHTGELLALPRDALARRIGLDAMNYLDRLLGTRADNRRWWRPPARFAHRVDLIEEIEDTERLAFPLRRLIVEFTRYLVARDTGIQQFRLELHHGRDVAATALDFVLSRPSRDESLLLRILRERFAALELPAPVRSLYLNAERFVHPGVRQHDLFDRSGMDDEDAAAVLDRLRARLGSTAVWKPQQADDHRPERAWRPAVPEQACAAAALARPSARRPAFLLRHPKRLQRPPPIVGGIERIESGWWDGVDTRRDYFVCELPDNARGWAYLDQADGQVYLHGLWS